MAVERCGKHGGYDGEAKPRNRCEACWRLYFQQADIVGALTDLGLQKKDQEVRRLRAAVKRLKDDAVERGALERLAARVESRAVEAAWAPRRRVAKGKSASFALLQCSDEHYGEKVDPEEMNGLNAYGPEIAAKRIRRFYENACVVANEYTSGVEYVGCCLVYGGDHVSGDIHEELARSNEATPFEAVRPLRDLHVAGVKLLRENFPEVRVVRISGGNHGRSDKRMPSKEAARRNFDALVDDLILEQFAGDKRVTWNSGKSQKAEFRLFGTPFEALHGHQFKGGSGIAGALSPLLLGKHRAAQVAASAHRPHEWLLVHHWHTLILGVAGILCNGTIKGYDEYALGRHFPYTEPEQVFAVVDKTHGVTMRAPIRCMGADEGWR